MFCFVAVWAAFELFVFGSRHDFLISDFLPFSQSRLSNQFLTWDSLSHAYQINFNVERWRRVTLIFCLLFLILGFFYDFMGEGSACIYLQISNINNLKNWSIIIIVSFNVSTCPFDLHIHAAGGLAVLYHLDYVHSLIPQSIPLSGLSDAG